MSAQWCRIAAPLHTYECGGGQLLHARPKIFRSGRDLTDGAALVVGMEGSTMTMTLYETLGVPADASLDEIKAAWRRTARATHPDAGGSEAAFVAAESAYATLSDPWLRSEYDRSLAEPEPVADPWVADDPADTSWVAEPAEPWVADPAPTGWDDSLDDMPRDWLNPVTLRRRIVANLACVLLALAGVVVTLHVTGQWAAAHQQGGVAVALEALGRLGIGLAITAVLSLAARRIIRRRGERW